VDDAMDAIEKENVSLKGVLPKVYARQNLDPAGLGELIAELEAQLKEEERLNKVIAENLSKIILKNG
jgi:hypothetical protein